MSGTTTRLGLKTPADPDPFLTSDFTDNYQLLDSYPGVFVCTSGTLPAWGAPQAGQLVFCTDTRTVLEWNGSGWQEPLAAPAGWNLATAIGTSISSSSSATFSVGTFTSTRAGHALAVVQVDFQPPNANTAVLMYGWPIINGSSFGTQYNWGQNGTTGSSSSFGGSRVSMITTGIAPVVAGSNSVSVYVNYQSLVSGGGTPSVFIALARVSLVMANSTNT